MITLFMRTKPNSHADLCVSLFALVFSLHDVPVVPVVVSHVDGATQQQP